MKKIISKLLYVAIASLLVVSCDQEEDVNYTPKNNITQGPSLSISFNNVTETGFDVIMNANAEGIAYYSISESNVSTPTLSSLVNSSVGAALVDGRRSLAASTDSSVSFSGVTGYRTYIVHAVMTSADGFGDTIISQSVTIPDATPPVFKRQDSGAVDFTPAHQTGGHDFKDQELTFKFSEPVKLAPNATFDIQFLEFGPTVIDQVQLVNPSFELGGEVVGEYATEVTIKGVNSQNDLFTVTNFAAGTFVDQSGLAAPALDGLANYFFRARQYTNLEVVDLLVADWDFTVTNNAFNPAVISTPNGRWSITKGATPGTIMLINQVDVDIDTFLGNASAVTNFMVNVQAPLPVGAANPLTRNSAFMTMVPTASTSSVADRLLRNGAVAFWTPFYENVNSNFNITDLAGFYDLDARAMQLRVDFGSQAGAADAANYFGDIQYDYTYVPGSGPLGRSASKTFTIFEGEVPAEMINSNPTDITLQDLLNFGSKPKGNLNTVLN